MQIFAKTKAKNEIKKAIKEKIKKELKAEIKKELMKEIKEELMKEIKEEIKEEIRIETKKEVKFGHQSRKIPPSSTRILTDLYSEDYCRIRTINLSADKENFSR